MPVLLEPSLTHWQSLTLVSQLYYPTGTLLVNRTPSGPRTLHTAREAMMCSLLPRLSRTTFALMMQRLALAARQPGVSRVGEAWLRAVGVDLAPEQVQSEALALQY
jgi:hypothetical protein